MTFWKWQWIRETVLKVRTTSVPLRPIKTGIWGQTWGAVLWSAFYNNNMTGISLTSAELQDADFMQEVSQIRFSVCLLSDKTCDTLWFLCIFTEIHSSWSVETALGPTAKASGYFPLRLWICARCVLQWCPASALAISWQCPIAVFCKQQVTTFTLFTKSKSGADCETNALFEVPRVSLNTVLPLFLLQILLLICLGWSHLSLSSFNRIS